MNYSKSKRKKLNWKTSECFKQKEIKSAKIVRKVE